MMDDTLMNLYSSSYKVLLARTKLEKDMAGSIKRANSFVCFVKKQKAKTKSHMYVYHLRFDFQYLQHVYNNSD